MRAGLTIKLAILLAGIGILASGLTGYYAYSANRAMLVSAAAAQWGVDASALRTSNGFVVGPGGKKLGYGELADEAMKMPVPQQVKLKDAKDFRIIGHATGRLDARAKSKMIFCCVSWSVRLSSGLKITGCLAKITSTFCSIAS